MLAVVTKHDLDVRRYSYWGVCAGSLTGPRTSSQDAASLPPSCCASCPYLPYGDFLHHLVMTFSRTRGFNPAHTLPRPHTPRAPSPPADRQTSDVYIDPMHVQQLHERASWFSAHTGILSNVRVKQSSAAKDRTTSSGTRKIQGVWGMAKEG